MTDGSAGPRITRKSCFSSACPNYQVIKMIFNLEPWYKSSREARKVLWRWLKKGKYIVKWGVAIWCYSYGQYIVITDKQEGGNSWRRGNVQLPIAINPEPIGNHMHCYCLHKDYRECPIPKQQYQVDEVFIAGQRLQSRQFLYILVFWIQQDMSVPSPWLSGDSTKLKSAIPLRFALVWFRPPFLFSGKTDNI